MGKALVDHCEPLFRHVCALNRSSRKNVKFSYEQARGDTLQLIDDLRFRAESEGLGHQFSRIENVLIFFVDSIVAESDLPFAEEWHEHRLANDRGKLAGDQEFFEVLEETLEERGRDANERLAVFYTCLGLGFAGMYAHQTEVLEKKMAVVGERLRVSSENETRRRLCPKAYESADTRRLMEPPGKSLVGLGIALVGLALVLFAANFYLFRSTSGELRKCLHMIVERGEAAQPTSPSDATE